MKGGREGARRFQPEHRRTGRVHQWLAQISPLVIAVRRPSTAASAYRRCQSTCPSCRRYGPCCPPCTMPCTNLQDPECGAAPVNKLAAWAHSCGPLVDHSARQNSCHNSSSSSSGRCHIHVSFAHPGTVSEPCLQKGHAGGRGGEAHPPEGRVSGGIDEGAADERQRRHTNRGQEEQHPAESTVRKLGPTAAVFGSSRACRRPRGGCGGSLHRGREDPVCSGTTTDHERVARRPTS